MMTTENICRVCDESCIFRAIVPCKRNGISTGYFRLRCILFDIMPLFERCVVSYDDYLKYYEEYTVIEGELRRKGGLLVL